MLRVGDDGVDIAPETEEIGAEIEPRNAACADERDELLIAQIALHIAERLRIAVARENGLFRNLQHVPEAALGDMGHIERHAHRLRRADEAAPLVGQTAAAVHRRAAERVVVVPCEVDDAHAAGVHARELHNAAIELLRTLDGEQRGDLSLAHGIVDVLRAAAEGDEVVVRVDLPRERGQNVVRFGDHRLAVANADGEHLRAGLEAGEPL